MIEDSLAKLYTRFAANVRQGLNLSGLAKSADPKCSGGVFLCVVYHVYVGFLYAQIDVTIRDCNVLIAQISKITIKLLAGRIVTAKLFDNLIILSFMFTDFYLDLQ